MFSNIFAFIGRNIRSVRKDTEGLVAFKEIGLEVDAEKTKYMVMSRHQNALKNQNITRSNKCLEKLEQFKCLETNLTVRNSFHEDMKSRLKSGNASYHSVPYKGTAGQHVACGPGVRGPLNQVNIVFSKRGLYGDG
jgi:hypothetical protein